jgi:hypothetical protein
VSAELRLWVYEDNLRAFLTVVGWIVGYSFDADDWFAVSSGVRESDAEANQWYEYELVGDHRAALRIGIDAGAEVVHVRCDVSPELQSQVRLASEIFAHFRVSEFRDGMSG